MLPVIGTYARHYAYRARNYASRIAKRLNKNPKNAALPCALPYPALKIGGLNIQTYTITATTATLASLWLIGRTAKAEGLSPWRARLTLLAGLVSGVAGARLAAIGRVLYLEGPQKLVEYTQQGADISSGYNPIGNDWFGGLALGLGVMTLMAKILKMPIRKFYDALAPAALLWHGISRIGCFLSDCCGGVETDSVLGVVFDGVAKHPTQLYMSVPDLAMAIFLAKWGPRLKRYDGQLLLAGLATHTATRFLVEFLREHPELPERLNDMLINFYQIPSLFLFLFSGGLLLYNYLRGGFSKKA